MDLFEWGGCSYNMTARDKEYLIRYWELKIKHRLNPDYTVKTKYGFITINNN